MALQEVGVVLSMVGVAGTVLICALPMWKVTAFIGTHLVVMQVFWEGLWMTCVSEYTGQMQCKLYDALLDLTPDLQAARGLVCISLVLGGLGFLLFLLGARCTNCLGHPRLKVRAVLSSGAIFCLAALTTIVGISWTAKSIIRDFYDPGVPEELKREMGAALYIGFITSLFLFCGGMFLCLSRPQTTTDPSPGHRYPSPGHRDPSPGHRYPSPGHRDPSPGHRDPSPGHRDPSPGHKDPSPGHRYPNTSPHCSYALKNYV